MSTKCKYICKIDYSSVLAGVVGEAAARLTGNIRSWSRAMKREIWKANDELMAELGMNRYQFEQARMAVGTRIRSGDSKKELQRVRLEDGSLAPASRIILYWKDRQNRMWYWINEELFAAYAGIPYGMQKVEASDLQTIENAAAEGSDLQTIDKNQKQERFIEEPIFFASEKREPKSDSDYEFTEIARQTALPRDVRLAEKSAERWVIEGNMRDLPQMRAVSVLVGRRYGAAIEYRQIERGLPAWAKTT
jgi:hypothetical protein